MTIRVDHCLTKILPFFSQLKITQGIILVSLALLDIYSITGMGEDCIVRRLYLLKNTLALAKMLCGKLGKRNEIGKKKAFFKKEEENQGETKSDPR